MMMLLIAVSCFGAGFLVGQLAVPEIGRAWAKALVEAIFGPPTK